MKEQKNPLITVITVVYNDVDAIRSTIESVVGQTCKQVEYIVVDGSSTDGTLNVIEEYAGLITKIISEKDTGIYNAMNKGIYHASGDYINFMNSGDTFAKRTTLTEVTPLLASREYDIIYGNVIVKKVDGNLWVKPAPDHLKVMHHIPFCHQSTFSRTSLLKDMKFDEKYKMSADFKFFKQCFLNKAKFVKIDIPVCIFNSNGISNLRRADGLRENIAIINELDKFFKRLIYKGRTYFVLVWMSIRRGLKRIKQANQV
jgi:glycosyltransferase involved in cell wall biosynthesis